MQILSGLRVVSGLTQSGGKSRIGRAFPSFDPFHPPFAVTEADRPSSQEAQQTSGLTQKLSWPCGVNAVPMDMTGIEQSLGRLVVQSGEPWVCNEDRTNFLPALET